jgi:hypothetical protein
MMLSHLSLDVSAQARLQTKVSRTQIEIGDEVQVTIELTTSPSVYKVLFPQYPDSLPGLEWIKINPIDTIRSSAEDTYRQVLSFTSFDSGIHVLPAFPIRLVNMKGSGEELRFTDSIRIEVNTVAVDTTQPFKPIRAIVEAKRPLWDIINSYVLPIVGLVALIVIFVWLFKRLKKNKKKPEEIKPKRLPHEEALMQLQQLKHQEAWLTLPPKEYYSSLTGILRRYLEEQFAMDCFEKTTSELMQQIKKEKVLNAYRKELRNLLETADLAKFAKSVPTEQEQLTDLENLIEMVQTSYKKIMQQQSIQTNPS